VQDKLAAHATLADFGLPQPEATIVASAEGLVAWQALPVFVKTPIGTATSGVRCVTDRDELVVLAATWDDEGVFADGGCSSSVRRSGRS